MLQGFHYPLTPKRRSTLNPPPPWYYSADFLDIEFWADPKVAAAVLPPGLDSDPSSERHCSALFYDWQFTGANEKYGTNRLIREVLRQLDYAGTTPITANRLTRGPGRMMPVRFNGSAFDGITTAP